MSFFPWQADARSVADVGIIHEMLFPSPIVDSSAIHCSNTTSGSCITSSSVPESTLEFLPLMLTSVYCALGIVWAWLRLSWVYLTT